MNYGYPSCYAAGGTSSNNLDMNNNLVNYPLDLSAQNASGSAFHSAVGPIGTKNDVYAFEDFKQELELPIVTENVIQWAMNSVSSSSSYPSLEELERMDASFRTKKRIIKDSCPKSEALKNAQKIRSNQRERERMRKQNHALVLIRKRLTDAFEQMPAVLGYIPPPLEGWEKKRRSKIITLKTCIEYLKWLISFNARLIEEDYGQQQYHSWVQTQQKSVIAFASTGNESD